ncbi:MAG: hypothetical protein LBS18_02785 [Clostridiales bacterium]|nr:hypothetical protein [Clostridiales bacterium]
MRLGIVLLWCLFILGVTGALRGPLNLLRARARPVAALMLLTLLLNAFPVSVTPELTINPAALAFCVGIGAITEVDTPNLALAFALSSITGALMALANRLIGIYAAGFIEPGLLLALTCLPFALFFRSVPATGLTLAALSPLFMSLYEAGMELRAFGYAVLTFGGPVAFDTQICAVCLCGISLLCVTPKKRTAPRPNGRVYGSLPEAKTPKKLR